MNTIFPTLRGVLIEKHRKRVEELCVKALGEQADSDSEKYGTRIANARTKTHRRLDSNEIPEFIMQKYEKDIYKMDIESADYYIQNILTKKDSNIVWRKITTQPGHENDCKVVIYADGNIASDEIKKGNITASKVDDAWTDLEMYISQEALAMAE